MQITKMSYECKWGLTGFYPSMVFIALVYNSGNQNVVINDWYVQNAYLSLLGYYLVIARL